jgi:hypothetical protein
VIVEIDDPSKADDLLAFLRTARCTAERAGPTRIIASPADSPTEEAARLELEAYLLAWQATHPGIRARRKPRYDL